jgi:RNA polymerase sigma-70 factor (ECF subfamily)
MRVEKERAVAPEGPGDEVVRVFEMLKPRERALLWLAYVEQDSHEEIATALAVKRSSVRVLLARARARLRDLLTARQTRT